MQVKQGLTQPRAAQCCSWASTNPCTNPCPHMVYCCQINIPHAAVPSSPAGLTYCSMSAPGCASPQVSG
jgi:hypothetical protein